MPIVARRRSGRKSPTSDARRALPWLVCAALCVAAVSWGFLRKSGGDGDVSPPAEPAAPPVGAGPYAEGRASKMTPGPIQSHDHTETFAAASSPHADENLPAGNPEAGHRHFASARELEEDCAAPAQPKVRPQPEVAQTMFGNTVEDQLEAVSREGFDSIVTLRVDLPQEEILEILRRPVEIYEDDDADTVAAKERTAEMKQAALDYIAAGGTFNQFLRDCQAEANEARETVTDVRNEMKRILLSQGEEAAREFLDRQNPLLREQGLPEVHIGKGLLMMAERRRVEE